MKLTLITVVFIGLLAGYQSGRGQATAPWIKDITMIPPMTPCLTISSQIGVSNIIQHTINLSPPNWISLTNVWVTNSPYVFVEASALPGTQRFYRVMVNGPMTNAMPGSMVLIPAGFFTMGDTLGDGGSDERPAHKVEVSAFYMDKYLVTKALWDQVYQWGISHGYSFDNPGSGQATNHPVHMTYWYDAVKWCNARSEQEGRVPAYHTSAGQTTVYRSGQVDVQNAWVKWNAGYRLPTEAEWEKAARGGLSGKRFPWGDTITHSQANYFSSGVDSWDISPTQGYYPNYPTGGLPGTSPVDTFAPNQYGLYDMAGNVWEWCWSRFESYIINSQTDPRGPDMGSIRVIRGGDWLHNATFSRTANRDYGIPNGVLYDVGFRTVLSPGQ